MRHTLHVTGLILAIGLVAWFSARQAAHWHSASSLWSATAHDAPTRPQVLINLAADALEHDRPEDAARWLDQAEAAAGSDRVALDYILANRASLDLREGRWREARTLLQSAPLTSVSRVLCRQFEGLCESTN